MKQCFVFILLGLCATSSWMNQVSAGILDDIESIFTGEIHILTRDEYFLDKSANRAHCGKTYESDSGFIHFFSSSLSSDLGSLVHDSGSTYQCDITIRASTSNILLEFTGTYVSVTDDMDCGNETSLSIKDGEDDSSAELNNEFQCGTEFYALNATNRYIETTGDAFFISVSLEAGQSVPNTGFKLLYTAYNALNLTDNENATCSDDEFLCDTDRCISETFTCDSAENCQDGTDESDDVVNCNWLVGTAAFLFGLGKTMFIVVASVILGFLLLMILICVCCCVHHKKKRKAKVRRININPKAK